MKKTILATAVAAAVMAAPMTAAANVVIYGKIHASLDYVSADEAYFRYRYQLPDYTDTQGSNWEVTSRTSRIGFKGSEDLGNGLKAIWKIEVGYDLDGDNNGNILVGSGWEGGRNSYIGLAGDWGTVLIGRHDTPLKISTGRLDVFADTMADYNSTLGFTDLRPDNVIAYISPNWNGFTFAAAGVAAEDYSGDIGDGAYSIAAMYFNNGFYGSLAWEDVSGVVDFDTFETGRVGLGYIMNAFTFGLVYEWQEVGYDVYSGNTDIEKFMISGAYDFGNNTVKAMWGRMHYDNNSSIPAHHNAYEFNGRHDAWAIGLDHKLSVRTKVYALYADSEVGLHNHSETYSPGIGGIGTGGDGFSMGMVHTF